MSKRPRSDSQSTSADEPTCDTPGTGFSTSREGSQQPEKYAHLDAPSMQAKAVMRCTLPPHDPLVFHTYDEYEVHYNQSHVNRCHECGKNLPTDHFLSLHIAENHDPLVATRQDRGDKTYACFVEGCDKVCADPHKRRMHLVDKHLFPKNYDFYIVNDGLDGRNSMLRTEHGQRRRSSAQAKPGLLRPTRNNEDHTDRLGITRHPYSPTSPPRTKAQLETATDTTVDDITTSLSSLKFVPHSVRFGRGRRSGFAAG